MSRTGLEVLVQAAADEQPLRTLGRAGGRGEPAGRDLVERHLGARGDVEDAEMRVADQLEDGHLHGLGAVAEGRVGKDLEVGDREAAGERQHQRR